MKNNLSNTKKKALKAKAHTLKPTVMVGQNGLTDAVLSEIDIALNVNELIKVRIRGADKKKRNEQVKKIESQLHSEVIDQIGGVTILYRPFANISH